MVKYEALPTTMILPKRTLLRTQHLPELVHIEDPAFSVMTDFTQTPPHTIQRKNTIDEAIDELKGKDVHLLLVINEKGEFQGIVSPEDVHGEKPIKLLQESRMPRNKILVDMVMVPACEITAFDIDTLKMAHVGHIIKTLSDHKKHYALAVSPNPEDDTQFILGVFTTAQIRKQLHTNY